MPHRGNTLVALAAIVVATHLLVPAAAQQQQLRELAAAATAPPAPVQPNRQLQIATALEATCGMAKFQEDIEFLDFQCCGPGECDDGLPPTTCPTAECAKALGGLKFGDCAGTFQRVTDTAWGSAPDGTSEAIEQLWASCGQLPLDRVQAVIDEQCAVTPPPPPPATGGGGHRRQLTREQKKERRRKRREQRQLQAVTLTQEAIIAGLNCEDCEGVQYGPARRDACGICGGSATNPLTCSQEYRQITSGTCMDIGMLPIADVDECGVAAAALGYPDTVAESGGYTGPDPRPEGCYAFMGNTQNCWNGAYQAPCTLFVSPDVPLFQGVGALDGVSTTVGGARVQDERFEDGFPHRQPFCKQPPAPTDARGNPCDGGRREFDSAEIDFSEGYDHNTQCSWMLTCTTGSPIVSFGSFQTEQNWDFVNIYDQSGARVARLTGDHVPDPIPSDGSEVRMEFTSDGSVARDGFSAFFSCESGMEPTRFEYFADALSQPDAEFQCTVNGGHLASVHSEDDSRLLDNMIDQNGGGSIWIGYQAHREESCDDRHHGGDIASNSFIWTDGTASDYEDWASGEPNDWRSGCAYRTDNDCTEIWRSGSPFPAGFHDANCDGRRPYICGLPMQDLPLPSGMPCSAEGRSETRPTEIDFTGGYGNGNTCFWTLTCTTGQPSFEFSSFNTEEGFDWVEVYDGQYDGSDDSSRLFRASGDGGGIRRVWGSSETTTVRFVSDGSITGDGFNARFSCSDNSCAVSACNGRGGTCIDGTAADRALSTCADICQGDGNGVCSRPPPPPSPPLPRFSGNQEYRGCFRDCAGGCDNRDMTGPSVEGSTLGPYASDVSIGVALDLDALVAAAPPGASIAEVAHSECAAVCSTNGYRYMGLQWEFQCVCDNEYGDFGPADGCGDSGERCGAGRQGDCGAINAVWELMDAGSAVCSEDDLREFDGDSTDVLTLDWGGMLGDGHTAGLGFYYGTDKGPPNVMFDTFSASGHVVAVSEPLDACTSITNSHELAGRLALVRRGTCTFLTKITTAQNAGAIGVIMYNTEPPYPRSMEWPMDSLREGSVEIGDVTIPAMFIDAESGDALNDALQFEPDMAVYIDRCDASSGPATTNVVATSAHGDTVRLSYTLDADKRNVYAMAGTADRPMAFPAAFQVAAPFGTDIGGVPAAFSAVSADAAFDSWLTVGVTDGSAGTAISASPGLGLDSWTATADFSTTSAAIFWMNPADGPSGAVVLAQLTGASGTATAVLQGRSAAGTDWQEVASWSL